KASEPELQPTPCATPQYWATSSSRPVTSGPRMTCPEARTLLRRASISGCNCRYWAGKSQSGMPPRVDIADSLQHEERLASWSRARSPACPTFPVADRGHFLRPRGPKSRWRAVFCQGGLRTRASAASGHFSLPTEGGGSQNPEQRTARERARG